jgi:hypothetical protein
MPRKKKGRDVTGWLCLDKAAGQTSTDAVASVKRLFGAAKVGHAGTLDPLAPAPCRRFGDATRPSLRAGRAQGHRFTVMGRETDTDDAEARVATCDMARHRCVGRSCGFTGESYSVRTASALKVDNGAPTILRAAALHPRRAAVDPRFSSSSSRPSPSWKPSAARHLRCALWPRPALGLPQSVSRSAAWSSGDEAAMIAGEA